VLPRSRWDVLDHDVLDWIMASGPPVEFARDLFEVRSMIETQSAGMAAQRRSHEDAVRINELLEGMAASVDDPESYIEIDLRFHTAIMSATHNELLMRLGGTLAVALEAAQAVTTRAPDGPRHSIAAHRAVADAIRASDHDAALRAMQELIEDSARDMDSALAARETAA
jgi:DNA-binding FadR family transcriptional regulator